jgi:hypothetical protein
MLMATAARCALEVLLHYRVYVIPPVGVGGRC